MLDQMLEVFSLRPDFDLNVMQANQSPLTSLAESLRNRSVLERSRPDCSLCKGHDHGVRRSWAAYHTRVPIAHVEAGLRTTDNSSRFPKK